mmetsp:Transcript_5946/g.11810  ORF Transcript_5946/g.11810 Transcript_5946/m.11810 type:complete len:101 (-) Transcript_5946:245-547(-)
MRLSPLRRREKEKIDASLELENYHWPPRLVSPVGTPKSKDDEMFVVPLEAYESSFPSFDFVCLTSSCLSRLTTSSSPFFTADRAKTGASVPTFVDRPIHG